MPAPQVDLSDPEEVRFVLDSLWDAAFPPEVETGIWRAVNFHNSTIWGDYRTLTNDTAWPVFGAMVDRSGLVHLRGMVRSVAGYTYGGGGTWPIFTLPEGLRPPWTLNGGLLQVDSLGNRAIPRVSLGSNGILSLTGQDYAQMGGNNGVCLYASVLIPPFPAVRLAT
jgi:hypothetical protein